MANGDLVKRSQQEYFNPRITEIVGFCERDDVPLPVTESEVVSSTTSTSTIPVSSPEPVTTSSAPITTEVEESATEVLPSETSTTVQETTTPQPESTPTPDPTSTSTFVAPPVESSTATTTSFFSSPSVSIRPNATSTTSFLQVGSAPSSAKMSGWTMMLSVLCVVILGMVL